MTAAEAWSSPPVDDVGYLPASFMLNMTDDELRGLIRNMRVARYEGWRNHKGLWRDLLGLDIPDRDVLDYGCGTGMEALELARAGNRVAVADIVPENVALARRVLQLHGFQARTWVLSHGRRPYGTFDCVNLSGVLHHIREPRPVIERVHRLLRPGGEARLMLYSDIGWRIATGTPPPEDVTAHPEFWKFVRFFDAVGDYADWYDVTKLEDRFGDLFQISRFEYLTPDYRYCAAVLERR